ncbi:MAG TPA: nucleotidyltransferase family protein [Symbiobacteriaceae bacterium]|nr:nucleotidyltransferase family protein [Symbiobacteriaceae bacterium]
MAPAKVITPTPHVHALPKEATATETPGNSPQGSPPEITAGDVIEIIQLFEQNHIELCIDGGWAVDALLGGQTRTHADLDIAVQHKDVPQIRTLLEAKGFRDIPRDDSWDCNFVMGDDRGRQVDIHSYTYDSAGKHVYGVAYPLESLTGTGRIQGYPVRCISPEWLVQFHTGYPLDENDYRDVKALCQRFGLALPAEYAPFVTTPDTRHLRGEE